jgi:hypothetical protein
MKRIVVALTLATSALAGQILPDEPYVEIIDGPDIPADWLAKELATEEGKKTSCWIYSDVNTLGWHGNIGPGNIQRAAWCAAQPIAIRKKYGSRY